MTLVSLRYAIISAGRACVKLQFRAIAAQQRYASSECALAVFYKRRRAKERYQHAQHNIAHCSALPLALASVA